jgi:hypothetical protein
VAYRGTRRGAVFQVSPLYALADILVATEEGLEMNLLAGGRAVRPTASMIAANQRIRRNTK